MVFYHRDKVCLVSTPDACKFEKSNCMEAIKTRGIVTNGVLTVHVPHNYDDKAVQVTIEADGNEASETEVQKAHEERVKRLLSIVGTAKNPNAPIDDYDIYDQ